MLPGCLSAGLWVGAGTDVPALFDGQRCPRTASYVPLGRLAHHFVSSFIEAGVFVFLFLCAFVLPLADVYGAQNESDQHAWSSAVSEWEQSEQCIGSLEFHLIHKRIPESPISRARTVHYVQLGSLVRLTLNEDRYLRAKKIWVNTRQDILNDGEREKSLIAGDTSVLGTLSRETHGINDGMVCQAPRFDQYYFVLPELLRRFSLPGGRILTLREVIESAGNTVVEPAGKLLGTPGVLLQLHGAVSTPGTGESDWSVEVLLSPGHRMHPIAVVETVTTGGSAHRRERQVTRFHEQDGVFFPAAVRGSAFRGASGGSLSLYAEYQFAIDDFTMNADVDVSRIDFKFPPNSFVFHTNQLRETSDLKRIEWTELLGAEGQVVQTFISLPDFERFLAELFSDSGSGHKLADSVGAKHALDTVTSPLQMTTQWVWSRGSILSILIVGIASIVLGFFLFRFKARRNRLASNAGGSGKNTPHSLCVLLLVSSIALLAESGCREPSLADVDNTNDASVVRMEPETSSRIDVAGEYLQGQILTVPFLVQNTNSEVLVVEALKGNCGCQSFNFRGESVVLPVSLSKGESLPVSLKINSAGKAGRSAFGVTLFGKQAGRAIQSRLLVTTNILVPLTVLPSVVEIKWSPTSEPEPIFADIVFGTAKCSAVREIVPSDRTLRCEVVANDSMTAQQIRVDPSVYWRERLKDSSETGFLHESILIYPQHPEVGISPGRLDLRFRRADISWRVVPDCLALTLRDGTTQARGTAILEACEPFDATRLRISCSADGFETNIRQLDGRRAMVVLTAGRPANPETVHELSVMLDESVVTTMHARVIHE